MANLDKLDFIVRVPDKIIQLFFCVPYIDFTLLVFSHFSIYAFNVPPQKKYKISK
jgi:hypothetical protein